MHKTIDDWRKEIDIIDKNMLTLLSKRMIIVKEIGRIKKITGQNIRDEQRWGSVITSRLLHAKKLHLSEKAVKKIFEIIHTYALKIEKNL